MTARRARTTSDFPFSSSSCGSSSSIARLDRQRRLLADEHRARHRRGLQPRRDVDRVAGGGTALRPLHAGEHLAGVDAHADSQSGRLEPDLRTELLDRTDEREPGAHCSLGVVVARTRDAEQRDDCVTDELLQHAAVALDRLARGAEVGVLDGAQILGIQTFAERGEPGKVREERGHHPAFEHPRESNP